MTSLDAVFWGLLLAAFVTGGLVGALALRARQRRRLVTLAPKMTMLQARYEMLAGASRRPCAVMLGDSLTAGVPWSEMTSCSGVANYGFNGDTSAGVLYRLNEIIRLRPRVVFLMIGANDILKGVPPAETSANVRAIVEELQAEGIAMIVHPVLPFVDAGDRVAELNRSIILALAETQAKIVTLPIDIPDLRDGLHLGPSGAAKWHDTIKALLEAHCSGHHAPDAATSA